MPDKKKSTPKRDDAADQVTTTSTHEIRTDQYGNLVSCVELESGDDVVVPLEFRYLVN